MLLCIPFGIIVFVWSHAISSFVCIFVNTWYLKRLIDYSTLEQMKDILCSLLGSLIMFIVVWPISLVNLSPCYLLVIQILSGLIVYGLFSWKYNRDLLIESISLVLRINK